MRTLKQLWRRWDDFWRYRIRQRITRLGFAYAATIVLVGVAAFISANNLLFLILSAMLATFLVSGFISRLGLAGLELDLHLPPHIAARQKVLATARVKNMKRWMPSFSILLSGMETAAEVSGDPDGGRLLTDLYFPVIAGGATLSESVELRFERRGIHKERSFQVLTRFPFGFTERREEIHIRHEVLVYPSLDPKPELDVVLKAAGDELPLARRGQGQDIYRIRPYQNLESSRHVDWKSTAHTGELQVREYAEDQDSGVLIYLDLDAPDARPWFEWAVEAAAVLAYELAAAGRPVRLKTQEYDVTTPEQGDIYTILKYLAVVSPDEGNSLAAPHDNTSFQVVFTQKPDRARSMGWCSAERGYGGRIFSAGDVFGSALASAKRNRS